jgi:CheY-like chemotaxis protein
MDRILFLDDDIFQTKYNVEELRKAFAVEPRADVNRAMLDFVAIKDAQGPWAGAVLDIMMPPGEFSAVSPDGMQTGWHVFKRLREVQPDLPVILMTNLAEDEVQSWFHDEENVTVLDKVHVLPDQLLQVAKQMFPRPSGSEA